MVQYRRGSDNNFFSNTNPQLIETNFKCQGIGRHIEQKTCQPSGMSKSLDEVLADYLRKARGDTPLRTFAKKIGVAHSTLSGIENRTQSITLKTLETIMKRLHVDFPDIFPQKKR